LKVITSIEEAAAHRSRLRRNGKRIALVPTMGALHEGHLSLVRAARSQADAVVVSIFVNPLQFGPNEDLDKYPRDLQRDQQLLEAEDVEMVFAPSAQEVYPQGPVTYVTVEGLSELLCGKSRPGHFRGVTTILAKLFHIVQPDLAFFGQKDAAQVAIVRRMVRDLNFQTELHVQPTVREADGLAMSSRNAYLTPALRKQATVLYRALMRIQTMSDRGEQRAYRLGNIGLEVMREEPDVSLEYLEIVDPETLQPVENVSKGALVAVAARVGETRLIDNLVLLGTGTAAGPQFS
jgi:pantoate--beta-alanine ligase